MPFLPKTLIKIWAIYNDWDAEIDDLKPNVYMAYRLLFELPTSSVHKTTHIGLATRLFFDTPDVTTEQIAYIEKLSTTKMSDFAFEELMKERKKQDEQLHYDAVRAKYRPNESTTKRH